MAGLCRQPVFSHKSVEFTTSDLEFPADTTVVPGLAGRWPQADSDRRVSFMPGLLGIIFMVDLMVARNGLPGYLDIRTQFQNAHVTNVPANPRPGAQNLFTPDTRTFYLGTVELA